MNKSTMFLQFFCAAVLAGCAVQPAELTTKNDRAPIVAKINLSSKNPRKEIIRHIYKKGEVEGLCQKGLNRLQTRLGSEITDAFSLDKVLADFSDDLSPLTFMAYVNTNVDVRNEGSACEEKYNKAMVDVFTRRALYQTVKATDARNAQERRLVGELKRQFEKNGMALSDAKLDELKKLKSELAELEAQFAKNLNEDKSAVEFTASELEGVSQDVLQRLNKSVDGKLIATTKNTDFLQVMENAKNPETRRRMLAAYDNRAAVANTDLLQRAVLLRQQIAKLMGFSKWSDYRIEGRMAQNTKNVMDLLLDLKSRLRPRLDADLKILLDAKKQMEDPAATQLSAWDIRYFVNQVKKRDYTLDDDVIRQYFPKDDVMKGMFQIYSTLFAVRFEEVKKASVWTKDVKLYAVRDQSTNAIISYFYTDFIPREGKYGHAAAFPLIAGRILADGYYSQPVASIVANFTPPTKDKPSLLTHDEVETLFHEFGHIMHQTLTRAPYAYLSGSSTAQDFVEAPSQMLENWVWDAEMLNKISGHYKNKKKKLPKDLVAKMIAARDFNQGYHYSRQLMLGLNDLALHTVNGAVDATATFRRVHEEVLTFPPIEGSHFNAGFGHLMGGYDAGYYGYIWSEVFAADMFTRFQKEGFLSKESGAAYREHILAEGNMQEPLDLITAFLGRAPNNEAFLKKLGL